MIQRQAALIAVIGVAVAHALVFDFVNDDAFISFRYADNLVQHGALVFNPGERVEGYTNFLWTMLLAFVIAIGLDPVVWSRWLGIAFAAATVGMVARLSGKLEERPSTWDALAPSMLALSPSFACWSTGGLETSLFTFLTTAGVGQYLIERDPRHEGWPTSGLWLAAAAMTRPEGMLVFAVLGLHRLLEMSIVDRAVRPTRRDWLWVLGFAAIFVPYFAWRWSYYGYPLPNTWYAKGGSDGMWPLGLRYWASWVTQNAVMWLIPVLALIPRALPGGGWNRLRSLAALLALAFSIHVIRVGGDFMALHRFLVPIMPVLALVGALGLRGFAGWLTSIGQPRAIVAAAIAALAIGAGLHARTIDEAALRLANDGGVDSIGWLIGFADQCSAIGRHLAMAAPPDTRISTTAAGAIPYYSRLYTLDQKGLSDEWIAHNVPPRTTMPRPGHMKSAPIEYILSQKIDYVISHPTIANSPPRKKTRELQLWRGRGYSWHTDRVPGLSGGWLGYWARDGAPR